MKKKYYYFIFLLAFSTNLLFSQNNVSQSDGIGYNYLGEDHRPFMRCEQYSDKEAEDLKLSFKQVMEKATTTRQKAITAAHFLATLPYAIPFGYESHEEGYELAWKYTRKGLFLNTVVENGRLYPAWGCDVLSSGLADDFRASLNNLGDTYKVGFHCSSFIRWCLYNADAVTQNILEGSWANDFGNFPGCIKVPLKEGLEQMKPGDLMYFPVDERNGHIAMIIGIKGDLVTFAESALWGGDHEDNRNGVRWRVFNMKTTNYDTYRFKWLIRMDNIYKD